MSHSSTIISLRRRNSENAAVATKENKAFWKYLQNVSFIVEAGDVAVEPLLRELQDLLLRLDNIEDSTMTRARK